MPFKGKPVRMQALTALAAAALLAAPGQASEGVQSISPSELRQLMSEALRANPEIQAAARDKEAAAQRIRPAGALDDPMLEAGLVNVPIESLRLNREDMTMKMLGIAQRFPYPGKRGLREQVAVKEAESAAFGYQETVHRVLRDVRTAYYDAALVDRSIEIVERNRQLVEQLLRIAEGRYSVGQGSQADLLRAQTQLAKMSEELLRMRRERHMIEAELARAAGRALPGTAIKVQMPGLAHVAMAFDQLRESALRDRPQLRGLRALIDKSERALDLARRDYYPDFDLRLQYGQREKAPDGMPRADVVTLTVAVSLPVWRAQKLDPKLGEALAMRDQVTSLLQAQQNEVVARLRQQVAIAEQTRESARLYETGILPQARLALESALSAFRVSRVDFPMLLDSQMTVLNYELSQAAAIVAHNKALAEIDLLTGRPLGLDQ